MLGFRETIFRVSSLRSVDEQLEKLTPIVCAGSCGHSRRRSADHVSCCWNVRLRYRTALYVSAGRSRSWPSRKAQTVKCLWIPTSAGPMQASHVRSFQLQRRKRLVSESPPFTNSALACTLADLTGLVPPWTLALPSSHSLCLMTAWPTCNRRAFNAHLLLLPTERSLADNALKTLPPGIFDSLQGLQQL